MKIRFPILYVIYFTLAANIIHAEEASSQKIEAARKLCNTLARSDEITDKIDSEIAKLPPVEISEIRNNNALIYCNIAYKAFPSDPMIIHHLARAEFARGDLSRGVELTKRSAELHYAPALIDLAGLYAGGQGVQRDYRKAAQYYEEAALTGHEHGMVLTGLSYLKGRGVDKNYDRAFDWFEKAYQGNKDPWAAYYLGLIYEEALGQPEDFSKAVKYYEYAAENKITNASYKLYLFYKYGIFLNKDKKMENYYRRLYEAK